MVCEVCLKTPEQLISEIKENKMYYDSNGLIVQQNGDGGDTANREGLDWFHFALLSSPEVKNISRESFVRVLNLLQVSPGIFIRNPIRYNDPKDFSRDQTIPLILAIGEMREYTVLSLLLRKQVKNLFRYQNGDIGLLGDLGYYIRAFRKFEWYPLLWLGDIQHLVNVLIRCIKGLDSNDVGDDINLTIALLQAQRVYETPISYIARKIYKWLRPGGVQRAWDWYFRPETGANNFNDLYRNLIENM